MYIYICGGFSFLSVNNNEGIHRAKITERTLLSDCVRLLVSHSRHVCCVTQQTCLLCDTADMSAVWQSRKMGRGGGGRGSPPPQRPDAKRWL